jgi:hypothetical protein
MHFGGYPAEYYAKYDVVTNIRPPVDDLARKIKSLNPNCWVLPSQDFQSPMEWFQYPDGWLVRDSHGKPVTVYTDEDPLADLTSYCPNIPVLGYPSLRYNQFAPAYLVDNSNLAISDGVATDGLWDALDRGVYQPDIDFDRNGVNDNTEHGDEWIKKVWLAGAETLIKNLRAKLGDKIFILNGGRFDNVSDLINGVMIEYAGPFGFNWYAGLGEYDRYMNIYRRPHVIIINPVDYAANNFQALRFYLATTLLGDGYLDFEDKGSYNHFYKGYYDEYDMDLGMPTSERYTLKCQSANGNNECVFVRFFEKGAVIVNAKSVSVSTHPSEIASLAGYTGPYYRFKGGQDPAWNNGAAFSEPVILAGTMQRDPNDPDSRMYVGDALILVNQPQTVVSEIIIGDSYPETSPGSSPAVLSGEWIQNCDGSEAWTSGCRPWLASPAHFFAIAPRGANTAAFHPTLGVPGQYEVFEWHGIPAGDQPASSVTHTISHANGSIQKMVNQSTNAGQWSSLGVYQFNSGSAQGVTISAQSANGVVLADAVKFVYRGSDPRSDNTPPSPPRGVKVVPQN